MRTGTLADESGGEGQRKPAREIRILVGFDRLNLGITRGPPFLLSIGCCRP